MSAESNRPPGGGGYGDLIRSGGLLFGVRVGGAICTYATQVILARWLGGPELGRYVEAFSWCLILSAISTFGMGSAALRFVGAYLARQEFEAVRGYLIRTRHLVVAISLSVVALGVLAVTWFAEPTDGASRTTLLLALACVPALSLLRLNQSMSHALSWLGFAFLPHMLLRPGILLLAVCVTWSLGLLHGASQVMALHLVVIVAVLTGQALVMRSRLRKSVPDVQPRFETRLWLRTSAPLLLLTLYTQYSPEVNVVVLGAYLSDGEVAVFSMAFRTAMLIAFGLSAIDAVHMPAVSRMHAQTDVAGMQAILVRSTRLKFWCALVAMGGLVLFGGHVLAFFGPEFVGGYAVLVVLGAVQVVRAALGPVAEILSITGHQDRSLLVCTCSLVGLIVVQASLLPFFGIVGGAVGVLVVVLVSQGWMFGLVVRHVGVRPWILAGVR